MLSKADKTDRNKTEGFDAEQDKASCSDPESQKEEKKSGKGRRTAYSYSAEDRKTLKRIFIAIAAGLAINVFIGLLLDAQELIDALRRTSLTLLILPFALIFLVFAIDSLRFKLVFSRFKIKISFRDSFFNNMTGYFFSSITPGSVGGQPFQVMHFAKLGIDSAVASNVVFSRLIEGNIVQLVIVALFFHKGIGMMTSLGKGAYLLLAGMIATIILTFVFTLSFLNPHLLGVLALKIDKSRLGRRISRILKNPCWAEKIYSWSQSLGQGFKTLWQNNIGTMIVDILGMALAQLIWAFSLYLPLAIITQTRPPIPDFLLSYTLCGLISLFVPTPGASGSVEAAYLLVMGTLTGRPAATLSAILIWRLGTYYLHLFVGGAKYFISKVPRGVYEKDARGILRRIRSAHQNPGKEGAQSGNKGNEQ